MLSPNKKEVINMQNAVIFRMGGKIHKTAALSHFSTNLSRYLWMGCRGFFYAKGRIMSDHFPPWVPPPDLWR